MNKFTQAALLAVSVSLPLACSSTQASVSPTDLGPIATGLCVEGAQVDFLRAMEGSFDVVYHIYTDVDQPGMKFQGNVHFAWNTSNHLLEGQHDSMWAGVPFRSSMMIGYDTFEDSYCMGWAKEDGSIAMPLANVEKSGTDNEMSIVRNDRGSISRSVLMIDSPDVHTVRQYTKNAENQDVLVMEMICTRL